MVTVLAGQVHPQGVTGLVAPIGVLAVAAATVGATRTTRTVAAGIRAGVLCATFTVLALFNLALLQISRPGSYTLTDSHDQAAFAHSGLPDVASFVLSDALGGAILAGLVLYPLTLALVAVACAHLATPRPGTTAPTHPAASS